MDESGARARHGVLAEADLNRIRAQFGVREAQVRRDHVISHILALLAPFSDEIVFFGGTALSRTLLPLLRLSEDIDLIASRDRTSAALRIQAALTRGLRRSFGEAIIRPALTNVSGAAPCVLAVSGVQVRIQLLSSVGYPKWPTEVVELEQRYADAPPARMRVLTPPAFAAAKLAAWNDRHAARDLYDMWGLAERGLIGREARDLFARFGPFTDASSVSFEAMPTADDWEISLGHQGILRVGPAEAAAVVRDAWAAA